MAKVSEPTNATGSLPLEDEPALIARIKAGDMSAFSRLVEMHYEPITRLAHSMLADQGDVPDVVQDSFVSAVQTLDRFRGDAKFRTWLTRIVINRCRTYERWRLLRNRTYRRWVELRQHEPKVINDESETHEEVRRAARGLPPKYREVIVLRYLEGLTACEMTELLGVSKNTIEARLSRARNRLKERLRTYLTSEKPDERT